MSYRPEFDNAGLAVGEVYGVRWWNLDNDGVLYGANGCDWQPGENVAHCKAPLTLLHPVPEETCGCGFWAYWKPPDAPEVSGSRKILGVIKGYGPTLVGERGFRCAKAEIVALHTAFKVMFRRGPGGMATYRSMTAGVQYTPVPPLIVDAEATMAIQILLEQEYQVPVYANPAAMLLRHPLTADYLPRPPAQAGTDPDDELSRLLGHLAAAGLKAPADMPLDTPEHRRCAVRFLHDMLQRHARGERTWLERIRLA